MIGSVDGIAGVTNAAGNVNYSAFLRTPLSTIDQGSEALGSMAASRILGLIRASANGQPPDGDFAHEFCHVNCACTL